MNEIHFDFQSLFIALKEQQARKNGPNFIMQLFGSPYFFAALISTTSLVGSIICAIYLYLNKHIQYRIFLIISLVVTWLYIFVTKGDGIYTLPFLYISYALLLNGTLKTIEKNNIPFLLTVVLILWVVGISIKDLIPKLGKNSTYFVFADIITKNIPNNSKVFISTLPDPYFELRKNNTLTIMHFLSATGYRKEYLRALDTMDYIVINHDLSIDVYGNLVTRYVQANAEAVGLVRPNGSEYSAYIIKLKPVGQRIKIE